MYIYKIHHVARSVAKIRLFSHLTTKSWICFSILRNFSVFLEKWHKKCLFALDKWRNYGSFVLEKRK